MGRHDRKEHRECPLTATVPQSDNAVGQGATGFTPPELRDDPLVSTPRRLSRHRDVLALRALDPLGYHDYVFALVHGRIEPASFLRLGVCRPGMPNALRC